MIRQCVVFVANLLMAALSRQLSINLKSSATSFHRFRLKNKVYGAGFKQEYGFGTKKLAVCKVR